MGKKKQKFGQHFLIDQVVIHNIVDTILASKSNLLLEIGPGRGALTIPIIAANKNVFAIEIDHNLIPILKNKVCFPKNLQILRQDVMQVDFNTIASELNTKNICIFGNLPYQISAVLMIKLRQYRQFIDEMVFMVQKEVADRLAAVPGSSSYGRLSVMTQAWCDIDIIIQVPQEAFSPPPEVLSSVFIARPKQRSDTINMNWELFAKVVLLAFRHKRKKCFSSFKYLFAAHVWQDLGLELSMRPADIDVSCYIKLTNFIGADPDLVAAIMN